MKTPGSRGLEMLAAVGLFACVVVGCGQMGPLTLPELESPAGDENDEDSRRESENED